jgi:TetR/AcrR family transcriptional repressor of uid operon
MTDVTESAFDLFEQPDGVSRESRRDQTIRRILEAARGCFVASGFQGASMQQICAAAGMSPGALYRYFPSKEAIINAIAEEDRREDMEIFSVMFDNPSVVDGVVEATMAYIRNIRDRDMAALFAEIRAESMRNPMISATCDLHREGVSDRFAAYLADAIERGEIAPEVDLQSILAMFMTIGEGLALNNLLALGMPEDQVEKLIRAMVAGMLRPTGVRADDVPVPPSSNR